MTVKKIIGFDLDGTLTQHKTPLESANRQVLERLAQKYHLVMVGAGACERIYRQMGEFPLDIIGNYGMQRAEVRDGKFALVENRSVEVDREAVDRVVTELRKEFHFEQYAGENVEFHASGVITFPILGTKAKIEDKVAYDPDRSKRRKVYARVCEAFAGYNVFIGGSSSFDITPPGYDKFNALKHFCSLKSATLDEVIYVGDDFGEGGNDSQVKLGGVDVIEIDDYRKFPERVAFLLK